MKGGYDPSFFEDLYAAEDRHFWFRGRNRAIAGLLAREASRLSPGYRVVEVGCGDGNVLRVLEEACRGGSVVGMDYFAEGLRFARRRSSCALVQGDLARPPFGSGFQIAGAFDVVEHLDDDRAALRYLWNMLAPGGLLLVTVPAHPSLWSEFDVEAGHCRRYTRQELAGKLEAAGFHVERLTYFMTSIYPLLRLSRTVGRGRTRRAGAVRRELQIFPVLNGVLAFLLAREADWLAAGRSLPGGTSLLAAARKPSEDR